MTKQEKIKKGLIQITKSKPMTYQLLRFLVENNCVIEVEGEELEVVDTFGRTYKTKCVAVESLVEGHFEFTSGATYSYKEVLDD